MLVMCAQPEIFFMLWLFVQVA